MNCRKYLIAFILVLSLMSSVLTGCSNSADRTVTFEQLISQADKYNGQSVTLEAFYFGGFEISALSGAVGPSTSGVWRIVPTGTLIWVEGGISEEVYKKLYQQTDTPSAYPERIGKLKVTGKFETGGQYGHLDAYQYQIAITSAEILEWSPPPAGGTSIPTSTLQIKVTDQNDSPLDGAKVASEEQPDGQLKVTGLTGAGGIAIFSDIKSGDYLFYISRYDYLQSKIGVTITAGQISNVTVKLDREG